MVTGCVRNHLNPLLDREDYRDLIAVPFSAFYGFSIMLLILLNRFDYLQAVTIVFGLPLHSLLAFNLERRIMS
jgi:hypothetical protein